MAVSAKERGFQKYQRWGIVIEQKFRVGRRSSTILKSTQPLKKEDKRFLMVATRMHHNIIGPYSIFVSSLYLAGNQYVKR